ncbi:hypothetical protein CEP53_005145 [Fusarium sp. AF-6]|nr:hypothetical protein CEP53_005145 [Fusarium sp. AF-6]
MHNLAQSGETAVALVVAGQIFQNFAFRNLGRALASTGFSASGIRNAIAGAKSDLFKHLSYETRDEVVRGITKDMQKSFCMVVTGGALTIAAVVLMVVVGKVGNGNSLLFLVRRLEQLNTPYIDRYKSLTPAGYRNMFFIIVEVGITDR